MNRRDVTKNRQRRSVKLFFTDGKPSILNTIFRQIFSTISANFRRLEPEFPLRVFPNASECLLSTRNSES